jgi:hypothetical protein
VFAISVGPRDFYGDALPIDPAGMSAWKYDVGANDRTFLVVSGTAANNVIYLRENGGNLEEWVDSPQPGQGTPTHVDALAGVVTLWVRGGGGDDAVVMDQSGGNILAAPTTASNPGGTISLTVVGTSTTDTVAIDGTARTFSFDSARLTFADVSAIVYWDSSDNDIIQTQGGIPVTLDLTGGDDITINGGNVVLNIIQPGAEFLVTDIAGAGSLTIGSANHWPDQRHKQKQNQRRDKGDQSGDSKELEQRAGRFFIKKREDAPSDKVG